MRLPQSVTSFVQGYFSFNHKHASLGAIIMFVYGRSASLDHPVGAFHCEGYTEPQSIFFFNVANQSYFVLIVVGRLF